eukprot:6023830-Pleurochrysis_carterae.AAC.6
MCTHAPEARTLAHGYSVFAQARTIHPSTARTALHCAHARTRTGANSRLRALTYAGTDTHRHHAAYRAHPLERAHAHIRIHT